MVIIQRRDGKGQKGVEVVVPESRVAKCASGVSFQQPALDHLDQQHGLGHLDHDHVLGHLDHEHGFGHLDQDHVLTVFCPDNTLQHPTWQKVAKC